MAPHEDDTQDTITWNDEVGARMKQIRLEADKSQLDVAKELGVTQATISNWERGLGGPDESQMAKMQNFLGRTLADTSIGNEPEATDLARWLREAIAEKQKAGLTIGAIASGAGVSVPTLYNILNGTVAAPQTRTVKRLEAYFGRVPEEVQKETEEARNLGTLGEFAQFDPYDETSWPNVPGVYILYDISARPVYIGKSKNSVASRLRDHESRFWFKRPLVTKAAYVGVSDAKLVADLELLLIKVVGVHSVLNQKGVIRDDEE